MADVQHTISLKRSWSGRQRASCQWEVELWQKRRMPYDWALRCKSIDSKTSTTLNAVCQCPATAHAKLSELYEITSAWRLSYRMETRSSSVSCHCAPSAHALNAALHMTRFGCTGARSSIASCHWPLRSHAAMAALWQTTFASTLRWPKVCRISMAFLHLAHLPHALIPVLQENASTLDLSFWMETRMASVVRHCLHRSHAVATVFCVKSSVCIPRLSSFIAESKADSQHPLWP